MSLIGEKAARYGLEAAVVYGVSMAESGLRPWVCRYEPRWKWLVDPAKVRPYDCSLATEKALQKTSWGIMQVMGAVLRELGYEGWITAIVALPAIQLDYGCIFLKKKIDRYGPVEGIAAYNSGKPIKGAGGKYINQAYIDKVLLCAKDYGRA